MYEKVLEFLHSIGYAGIIISGFSEGLFLPFPMELIYIPVATANPAKAINYTLLLICFSIIGSVIAYAIGRSGGQKLLLKISLIKRNFTRIQSLYDKNSFMALLTSSFTPLPYEIYTFSAGAFGVGFKKFIIASAMSRLIRYVPQGMLIYLYGSKVLSFIKKYGILAAIILVGVIFIVKSLFTKVYIILKKQKNKNR